MKRDPNKYPKGWNRTRVESVISHYDAQTADEAIAEADAAWENSRTTLIRVPIELAEDVRRLIADRKTKTPATPTARRKTA